MNTSTKTLKYHHGTTQIFMKRIMLKKLCVFWQARLRFAAIVMCRAAQSFTNGPVPINASMSGHDEKGVLTTRTMLWVIISVRAICVFQKFYIVLLSSKSNYFFKMTESTDNQLLSCIQYNMYFRQKPAKNDRHVQLFQNGCLAFAGQLKNLSICPSIYLFHQSGKRCQKNFIFSKIRQQEARRPI